MGIGVVKIKDYRFSVDLTFEKDIIVEGDAKVNNLIVNGVAISPKISVYSASGAIDTSDSVAFFDSSSSVLAMTLADGYEGQVLHLLAGSSNNNAVVTPAHGYTGSTITFTTAYQAASLIFVRGSWALLSTTV